MLGSGWPEVQDTVTSDMKSDWESPAVSHKGVGSLAISNAVYVNVRKQRASDRSRYM